MAAPVGVSIAAGWTKVGEYVHGLSFLPGPGLMQVAVAVLVVKTSSAVTDTSDAVNVVVHVVVTGWGVRVLVRLAVREGIVKVVKGPVVLTNVDVVVAVVLIVGVVVTLNVIVGVTVDVICGPASIVIS